MRLNLYPYYVHTLLKLINVRIPPVKYGANHMPKNKYSYLSIYYILTIIRILNNILNIGNMVPNDV